MMLKTIKTVLLAGSMGAFLGGCTEISEYFGDGDPADVSKCAFVLADVDEGPYLLCAECDSGSTSTATASYCGTELSVRCNAKTADDVYGIALGGFVEGGALTGTAWLDEDDDGADDDPDELLCHQQAVSGTIKQEVKCTSALTGNGKTGADTFEASIKYDASKNTCP